MGGRTSKKAEDDHERAAAAVARQMPHTEHELLQEGALWRLAKAALADLKISVDEGEFIQAFGAGPVRHGTGGVHHSLSSLGDTQHAAVPLALQSLQSRVVAFVAAACMCERVRQGTSATRGPSKSVRGPSSSTTSTSSAQDAASSDEEGDEEDWYPSGLMDIIAAPEPWQALVQASALLDDRPAMQRELGACVLPEFASPRRPSVNTVGFPTTYVLRQEQYDIADLSTMYMSLCSMLGLTEYFNPRVDRQALLQV